MKNHWVLSDCPHYESDQINEKLKFAYWEGHRDFAYDLLNFVKPRKIIELGSQYGCSLFAFCQSVKDNGLNTQINAVDYWKGDIGAENTGEEVYEIVKQTIKKLFQNVDIHLYQMDFDSALDSFEDSSIDILHIDGGHRYEDVEHDLSTWVGKLKENGIILFHDVFSHIDSGSCEHWEQIKKKYPASYFEFKHSCGLGILFPKGSYWYENMISEGFLEKYYPVYYYRSMYKYAKKRFEELEGLYRRRYEAITDQSKMIAERDTVIASQKALIDEKDEGIRNQSQMIDERDAVIASQKTLIDE
ncbi:MAG: class I SAM-dependent methyltransferase, partial [Lachnospiraceae bacterium]|nr:class I SAM-dependent methyltransferase [Lachnospiraceae bacterium]